MDILPRIVGAFYAFGGWVALRALLMDNLLDKMLATLTLAGTDRKDTIRQWVLGTGAVLTSLSGVALILMSWWAVPLFLANLGVQAGWLLWARKAFPPTEPGDAEGRRSTINAAVGYTGVTGLVLWLDWRGRLGPVTEPIAPIVIVLTTAGLLLWLARSLLWRPGQIEGALEPLPEIEPVEHRDPVRVRLEPRLGDWCLWDADDGRGLHPSDYLPTDLAERILHWELVAHAGLDWEEPDGPPRFENEDHARVYAEDGRAIVLDLEAIYGRGNVEGPVFES